MYCPLPSSEATWKCPGETSITYCCTRGVVSAPAGAALGEPSRASSDSGDGLGSRKLGVELERDRPNGDGFVCGGGVCCRVCCCCPAAPPAARSFCELPISLSSSLDADDDWRRPSPASAAAPPAAAPPGEPGAAVAAAANAAPGSVVAGAASAELRGVKAPNGPLRNRLAADTRDAMAALSLAPWRATRARLARIADVASSMV